MKLFQAKNNSEYWLILPVATLSFPALQPCV